MKAPHVFREFTRGFRQGALEDAKEEDWIARAFQYLDSSGRSELKNYLTKLLDSDVSGHDLQELWWEGLADYYVADDAELRSLLRLVRDLA